MTILTEAARPGEAILHEDPRSRDVITIMQSQTLRANQILGASTTAATVAAAVAGAGNTGNGTVTLATPAFGVLARPGTYTLLCIEPAANGGVFAVEGPDGIVAGRAVVGSAFSGPINFTINDGSTDFASGDRFTVAVSAVTQQFGAFDPAATDGRQVARCMLFDAVTTGSGQTAQAVGIMRAAALNGRKLQWLTGLTNTQIATATEQMNAAPHGLTIRTV
jgi:hypothetical protein